MSNERQGDGTGGAHDEIPALFATIHHRSEERPDGYTPQDIAWLNVEANRHLPELRQLLLENFRRLFPDDLRGRQ